MQEMKPLKMSYTKGRPADELTAAIIEYVDMYQFAEELVRTLSEAKKKGGLSPKVELREAQEFWLCLMNDAWEHAKAYVNGLKLESKGR
ncbi:hypothetical protein HYR54_14935 [Candidatus Acetothermia bacterium]|nr:hypothetical protein [Candidatus Acetothermia bacterium]